MTLNIFFSWQVETDLQGFNNKAFLIECINSAIKIVENKGALKGIRLKLVEGLRDVSGNPEVASMMFRQIDDCDIFIGDMTTAQRICNRLEKLRNKKCLYFRYSPNCNVYGEYNRALGLHPEFWRQVILLQNDTNKIPEEDKSVIPFDTRHRRWPITFTLINNSEESKNEAKKAILNVLPEAIQRCAIAARERIDKRYAPFTTWFKLRKDGRLNRYRINENLIAKYKDRIHNSKGVIRLLGPEGLFKTFLVLRVFEEDEYANVYLYVDCYFSKFEEFKIQYEYLLENVNDAIIVFDNCDANNFQKILELRLKYKAGNKIVVITTKDCQENSNSLNYIDIDATQDLENEISSTFDQAGILLQETREQVEQFCDGNIGLITSLLSNLNKGKTINTLDGRRLLTLMYNADESQSERVFLRSIALFDCIGWKENKADELSTIILNKDITPLDIDSKVLLNNAKSYIKKLIKQGLVIERGRTISLYPKTAARELVVEWLEEVDEERFLNVLRSLLDSPQNKSLIREFHDQFKHLGKSDEARSIIERLLRIGGAFDNINLINSDAGAMLIESFVQVNPQAVANLLLSVINTRSLEELRDVYEGRRYLVWTIEKICFRHETFSQGAYLMMRLAMAENESISNNATGEFIRLFPIMLPATSATLNERLNFLQNNINVKEQKPIILSALKRALHVRDFLLMSGAEVFGEEKLEPYRPQTKDEIWAYLAGCVDLLNKEIKASKENTSSIVELLENDTIAMCDCGYADIILPLVKEVATIKNNDWVKMQETLSFFKNRIWGKMPSNAQALYDEVLNSITKQDIVSRFARIEKENYQNDNRFDFDFRWKRQREEYDKIAHELYDNSLLTAENLRELIKIECISSYPFGKVLAEQMSAEEQISFIEKYVEILNQEKDATISILCDFVSSINDDTFDEVLPTLQKARITSTVFACMGTRNITPENPAYELMHKLVEEQKSDTEAYLQYWTRINLNILTEEHLLKLFSDVLSFVDGFPIAIKMISFLLLGNRGTSYPSLFELAENSLIEYHQSGKSLLAVDNAMMISMVLLRGGKRKSLAGIINESILQHFVNSDTYLGHSYEIEEVYRILMNLYFDIIWPSLSQALLSEGEEFMTYYHLKEFLGVDLVDGTKPIIMEGNHFAEMLEWCKNHPDIAPVRLASMIQVVGENEQFSPEALTLIDYFGDRDYVLDEIGCTLDSFFSVGSVVPYYEKRKRIYSSILQHPKLKVREWGQRQIKACDYYIQNALTREEEKI